MSRVAQVLKSKTVIAVALVIVIAAGVGIGVDVHSVLVLANVAKNLIKGL